MKPFLPSFVLLAALAAGPALAQSLPEVFLYKSPTCGCCTKWADHMKQNGFKVTIREVNDIPGNRKKLGMPENLGSCHTSTIGAYVIEGHVPAADVKRLLKDKTKALGLAVPSMPAGSPGMDIPNSPPYETFLVQPDGRTSVYAKH